MVVLSPHVFLPASCPQCCILITEKCAVEREREAKGQGLLEVGHFPLLAALSSGFLLFLKSWPMDGAGVGIREGWGITAKLSHWMLKAGGVSGRKTQALKELKKKCGGYPQLLAVWFWWGYVKGWVLFLAWDPRPPSQGQNPNNG